MAVVKIIMVKPFLCDTYTSVHIQYTFVNNNNNNNLIIIEQTVLRCFKILYSHSTAHWCFFLWVYQLILPGVVAVVVVVRWVHSH